MEVPSASGCATWDCCRSAIGFSTHEQSPYYPRRFFSLCHRDEPCGPAFEQAFEPAASAVDLLREYRITAVAPSTSSHSETSPGESEYQRDVRWRRNHAYRSLLGPPPAERARAAESRRVVSSLSPRRLLQNRPSPDDRGVHPPSQPSDFYLVRFVPVMAPARLDNERHREIAMRLAGRFHDRLDDSRGVLGLAFRHLEQQLVVDLQQHTCF